MIQGYAICKGGSVDLDKAGSNLVTEVVKLAEKGWTPQGGISHITIIGADFIQHIFTQAMVKHGGA